MATDSLVTQPTDLVLSSTDWVAFVDETGHDSLTDPGHPVFGLGGCAAPALEVNELIVGSWLRLRESVFADVTGPMHAAELAPTPNQIVALADFFRRTPFKRFAALVSDRSSPTARKEAYEKCSSTVLAFLHYFASEAGCKRIVLIFESVSKKDELPSWFLRQQVRWLGNPHEFLPVHIWRAKKQWEVPGLEVADFVMHAAGCQIRSDSKRPGFVRKDFEAVFSGVPDEWVRFGWLATAAEDQG